MIYNYLEIDKLSLLLSSDSNTKVMALTESQQAEHINEQHILLISSG